MSNELDRAVAVEVMGLKCLHPRSQLKNESWVEYTDDYEGTCGVCGAEVVIPKHATDAVKGYSTDPAAMMEVIAKLRDDGLAVYIQTRGDKWECTLVDSNCEEYEATDAPTMMEAVASAALAAVRAGGGTA